jgi:hypothetical protein
VINESKLVLRDKAGGKKTVETEQGGKGKATDDLRRLLRDLGRAQ